MDVDRKIQQLKKLIVTAEGETLTYLVERLQTLLAKQKAERQAKEREDQPVAADTQPPLLEVKEKHSALKIVGINYNVLKDMYIKSEGVRDYVMKCCANIINNVTKDENLVNLTKQKHYLQLKAVFEYAHDKTYEPILKTIKKPFYPNKLIQRSNLVQSVDDIRRIVETQAEEILRMIHNFEHEGSNWVIVKPISFKLRFIKYLDRFNRARGFIPTPSWLANRKAIINIQNEDNDCFLKCIYHYFNRDNNHHDYRDINRDFLDDFLLSRHIYTGIFRDGVTTEALRYFEKTYKIRINIYYIDPRGSQSTLNTITYQCITTKTMTQ
jgi:hypothetical protein